MHFADCTHAAPPCQPDLFRREMADRVRFPVILQRSHGRSQPRRACIDPHRALQESFNPTPANTAPTLLPFVAAEAAPSCVQRAGCTVGATSVPTPCGYGNIIAGVRHSRISSCKCLQATRWVHCGSDFSPDALRLRQHHRWRSSRPNLLCKDLQAIRWVHCGRDFSPDTLELGQHHHCVRRG